jgi:phenylacetate-CoA ligase
MTLQYGAGWLQSLYNYLPVFAQNVMTSIYGLRLQKRAYGRYYRRYFAELEQSQWHTASQLQTLQNRRLRDFVAYAYAQSPYWNRLLTDLGLGPAEIRTPDDLRRLPILEKETLHQRIHEIEAREYVNGNKDVVAVHTSGTSGKALHLNLSREVWEREYAFRQLHRSWGGIRRGDKVATFGGHPVVPTDQPRPPYWRENWAERQVIFSSQHIAPDAVPHIAERLARFQPDLIHGYPSSLYLVALYLDAEGINEIRPRAVQTHSETLLDYQRNVLERVFDCKVYNWYGCTEMVANIVECEFGSLHVKMEYSVVEFIRPDGEPAGPGEMGELVCTAFGNYATPLIRYRVGDVAVLSDWQECECGRSGPLVQQIVGRMEDIIVTPDGRHVGRLDHVFKDTLNVAEAQIVQETKDAVLVRMVKRAGFGERDMHLLEKELRLRLGPLIRIEYEFVDQIPRESNGKFRFAISKVPLQIGKASSEIKEL